MYKDVCFIYQLLWLLRNIVDWAFKFSFRWAQNTRLKNKAKERKLDEVTSLVF